jgi:HEAT repeat protein
VVGRASFRAERAGDGGLRDGGGVSPSALAQRAEPCRITAERDRKKSRMASPGRARRRLRASQRGRSLASPSRNVSDTLRSHVAPKPEFVNASLPILRTVMDGLRAKVRDRAGRWLDRARAQAGSAAPVAAVWLDPAHALEFITKLRDGQVPPELERVGDQVQRIGERTFARLAKRWPALGDLIAEPAQAIRRRTRSVRKASATNGSTGPLDEAALELLVVQLVAAPNWQSRASAAEELAMLDGEGVLEALTRALRDPSVEVAISAIDALARRQDKASLDALRVVLDNHDGYFSPVTRVAALTALGRMLSDSELGPLVARVRDLDAEVSIAAIAVVADRKQTTAAEHLLPILRDTSGYFLPLVRLAATNALTKAGALTPQLAQQLLDREEAAAVRRVLERVAQCPP